MKAWLLDQLAGIEHLRLAEAPDPTSGAGDVVLDLQFAALNPVDRYLAQNEYPGKPPLPHVLGRDGVGVVSAVGSGVKDVQVGQRMLIIRGDTGVNRWGSFAERVAVAADSLAPVPVGWSIQEAAGASLVYLTAYQALTQWGELGASVVLITGASGGVGVASVQLAKAMGHTVVALSRSEAKQKRLRELGADFTVDPCDANWVGDLKKKLGARRVDLAVDNIGGAEFAQVIETMGGNGRVSVVGRLAGAVPEFNTASLFFRRLKIGGVAVGTYTRPQAHAAWVSLQELLKRTEARPVVDRVFAFGELPAAFERLKEGPMGKVLLEISGG
jgi:NADPH:quinone reductase